MKLLKRTNKCSELNEKNLTQKLILQGWVDRRRDHGGIIFVDLRDLSGIIQLVFDPAVDKQSHLSAEDIRPEYVLQVQGVLKERDEQSINPQMKTGKWEVFVSQIEILNSSKTPPFLINESQEINEKILLEYRYLDLRRTQLQKNLILRSQANSLIRNFLAKENFLEIETPILTRSTPEGARDFIVPSRIQAGNFYALPQSPQLFKQALWHRWFRFKISRALEMKIYAKIANQNQIDLELSFVKRETIFEIYRKNLLCFGPLGVNLIAFSYYGPQRSYAN